MRVNLKLARLLLNLTVLGTSFLYFLRGMSPRFLLIPTTVAIVFVNAVFSWAQRSRRSEALPAVTGSTAKGPEQSTSDAKLARLNARLLFSAALVGGILWGLGTAHETKHWIFLPAGLFVGYTLGQVLLKKYR